MLLAGELCQRMHDRLHDLELVRDRSAVLDIVLRSFVGVVAVDGRLVTFVLDVLRNLKVEVLLRALVEGFNRGVGPSSHRKPFSFSAICRTFLIVFSTTRLLTSWLGPWGMTVTSLPASLIFRCFLLFSTSQGNPVASSALASSGGTFIALRLRSYRQPV